MSINLDRLDRWVALLATVICAACAFVAFNNRWGYVVPLLPGALFWDANVFASAGHEIAQGIDPYLGPAIQNPFQLPYVCAPQVSVVLGALSSLLGPALFPLLALLHIAALIGAPLILTRLFIGKAWPDAALGYGLFACGLGAFGVTTIIAGNFGAVLYLAIFAAMIPGLRENKWLWFHIAVAVAAQVKPPYVLLWIVPVLVNGWSWKQLRHAVIAGTATLVPYVVAYLFDRTHFNEWLASVANQFAIGDYGFSPYGGVLRVDKTLIDGPVPMIVHALVCAPLGLFLLFDRTKGTFKAAALIVFAILANPRMKEYDLSFAVIPVVGLYLAALVPQAGDAKRRALGIGLVLVLTLVMLRADQIPVLGPFTYTIAIAAAILSRAYRRPASPPIVTQAA
jgi:hypothetical protein